ncbi:MAG TPA: DAK2 domain-containing protein [Nitriliruptorales bacterium]
MTEDAPAEPLTAARVGALLGRVHHAFARHRDEIDELNVFPVPDGDTGSNLVLTARAAVDALGEGADEGAVQAMVRGGIMGARGNSGVILSQVLRALGEAVDDRDLDPLATYVRALRRGCELAYEAVAEPVEGTMLTAIRVGAECGEAARADTLDELSAQVVAAVSEAVQGTRLQLEANREAGVVDAGARGFEVFLQAVHDHLTDAPDPGDAPPPLVARDRNRRAEREDGSLEYRYEVQYLLQADEAHAAELRQRLARLGDSVVVVGAGDLMNVHVHTNRIGETIEAGVAFGQPARIEVTGFADEIAEREARATAAHAPGQRAPRRPVAPVVVLDGAGLTELAEELGATVVPGTSGQLPTVADLLDAIAHTDGERIAILPGHRNVVPTANLASGVAAAEAGRDLVVIDEADSPAAALAALAVCDPAGDVEATIAGMRHAAEACRCGEVVGAVRDADTPAGRVRRGQALAVVAGQVTAAFDDPVDAVAAVARVLASDGTEVVTLIVGADVDAAERDRAEAAVREVLGAAAELDVIDGGQAPQRYHLGAE